MKQEVRSQEKNTIDSGDEKGKVKVHPFLARVSVHRGHKGQIFIYGVGGLGDIYPNLCGCRADCQEKQKGNAECGMRNAAGA
jgi:hypothetical protein